MRQLNKFLCRLGRQYLNQQSFLYFLNRHRYKDITRGFSSVLNNSLSITATSKFKPSYTPHSPRCVRHISSHSHDVNEKHDGSSKILYDGECKICQVEISVLKRFVGTSEAVKFIDISKADYDPKKHGGVSYEDAMKEMHVVGSDGKVYTQGDAVRHMYRLSGLSWLAAATELPLIKPVCDDLYVKFAEYRLRKAFDRCDDGSCNIKLKHLRDKLNKSEK